MVATCNNEVRRGGVKRTRLAVHKNMMEAYVYTLVVDGHTHERRLPTPQQHSPQRHTAAGTAASTTKDTGTAASTTTDTGNTVPPRANPTQNGLCSLPKEAPGPG